jgi:uncharacterized protein (TIGR03083 family)
VIGMIEDRAALEAFRCEAGQLSRALTGVRGADWARPTRCEPWSVRELLGHIGVVIGWLPQMVEGPAPDRADVSAARYYRPDDRFSPQTNAARIQLARDLAADHVDGAGLAAGFASIWQQAYRQCRDEPVDRIVRTRHGDAMLLSEFLVTRVVEVAVHGLDIADALGREPWLTTEAEETVLGLVIGPAHREHARELRWDGPTALRKVTGRAALTEAESSRIERLGINWITLG